MDYDPDYYYDLDPQSNLDINVIKSVRADYYIEPSITKALSHQPLWWVEILYSVKIERHTSLAF